MQAGICQWETSRPVTCGNKHRHPENHKLSPTASRTPLSDTAGRHCVDGQWVRCVGGTRVARWVPCGYTWVYGMSGHYRVHRIGQASLASQTCRLGRSGRSVRQVGQSDRSDSQIDRSVRQISFSYGNLEISRFRALMDFPVSGLGYRGNKPNLTALRILH